MRRTAWIAVAVVLAAGACSRKADPNMAALEKQFEESLSGSTLVGSFTAGNSNQLREDKYTITKVSKVSGDTWLFQAKFRDLPIPIPLTVKWAGDTPVIVMTDVGVPGMGTYTARVLFYGDQYVGTWKGQKGGGQMFGRIVKTPAP